MAFIDERKISSIKKQISNYIYSDFVLKESRPCLTQRKHFEIGLNHDE